MAHLAVPSAASFAKSCDISTEARGRSRIRVDRRAAAAEDRHDREPARSDGYCVSCGFSQKRAPFGVSLIAPAFAERALLDLTARPYA
jgi:hypothetical protein